jgi:hypothetical protein
VQSDTHSGLDEKIHLFRSYFNPTQPNVKELDDRTINLHRQVLETPIWKIARATSAAPTYFRSIQVDGLRLIDGGLLANNPSQHARAEVNSMHRVHPSGPCRLVEGTPEGGIRFLVSLGTGKQASQAITRGAGLPKVVSIVRRALKEMTNPEPVHIELETALDPSVYYRFNVEKDLRNMKLDECIVKGEVNLTFSKIEKAVTEYFNDGDVWDRSMELARQLVEHRRQRRRPGHEWFRNLTVPGPLPSPIDDRYRSDDVPSGTANSMANSMTNSMTNSMAPGPRRSSVPGMSSRAAEMPAPVPEMPTGLMTSELGLRSPVQDSTQSLPTSPTYMPFDSAMTPQEEWCTPSPRVLQYHTPS